MKESYTNLCKACYIRIMKPSKKKIKKIVMTPYEGKCDKCGRISVFVDYVEDDD